MSSENTGVDRVPLNNSCTCAMTVDSPARSALGPRASFLLAHERLALLAGAASEPSVVVAAVDANGQVVASFRVLDRQALIVGRHTRCGIRLPALTVSLRHLAALVRFEGARAVIHLRDLATEHPFVTEDGERSAGVIADGPLYAAIDEYALWWVPSEALAGSLSGRAEKAWNDLAPRRFLERRPPVAAPKQPARLVEQSYVTHVAPPLLLGDGDGPEIAWGMLRFEAGTRKEKRWVSAERLEQGILLGRYGRCSVLLDTPEATVSRVHALLIRLGTEVWVLDAASTNGIRRGEAAVSAEVLRDTDRLALGREVTLDWERSQHAEA
jgi:hypothetical protein